MSTATICEIRIKCIEIESIEVFVFFQISFRLASFIVQPPSFWVHQQIISFVDRNEHIFAVRVFIFVGMIFTCEIFVGSLDFWNGFRPLYTEYMVRVVCKRTR